MQKCTHHEIFMLLELINSLSNMLHSI